MSKPNRRATFQEEESIYNIIPPTPEEVIKQPRYRSRFPSAIFPTGSTFGSHTTSNPLVQNLGGEFYQPDFGHSRRGRESSIGQLSVASSVSPNVFLRKGHGQTRSRLPSISSPQSSNQSSAISSSNLYSAGSSGKRFNDIRNPPVPLRNESPSFISRVPKNYIFENIATNIMTSPPKVETPQNWITRKGFGQTPKYLDRVKNQIQQDYKLMASMLDNEGESRSPNRMYEMSQVEIEELKTALKAKWNVLNQEYQKQTHIVKFDIGSQNAKRQEIINQLTQIEKDIELLNRKGKLLIDGSR